MRIHQQSARMAALNARKAKLSDPAKIDEAAREYEAVFLSQMLQHMFAGVETDPVTGGGHGEDIYRSFIVDEYGKLMSRAGGIGIADHVKREMLRLQEVK